MNSRKLQQVYTPPAQPGFLGRGHIARPVIQKSYAESDPFILLMDDILDKKDEEPAGGPHPHAGFETGTLVIEGAFGEGEHRMKTGDFALMTAGQGIVHTETITEKTKLRILQLWLNLPKKDRRATPRIQTLPSEHVPTVSRDGVTVRVYSGAFAGKESPVKNYTPMVLADISMRPGTALQEVIPAHYNAFFYVLEGSVGVDLDTETVGSNQVGWLEYGAGDESEINLQAGNDGARLILYAAEPQKHDIVSHGPFIADSMEDIRQLYADFRFGKMGHINEVDASHQVVL